MVVKDLLLCRHASAVLVTYDDFSTILPNIYSGRTPDASTKCERALGWEASEKFGARRDLLQPVRQPFKSVLNNCSAGEYFIELD